MDFRSVEKDETMLRRIVLSMSLLLGVACFGPMTQAVEACPMCKVANEQDSLLPSAYMYSILFMMGMIFSLGSGVGLVVFSISRRENAALEAMGQFGGASTEASSLGLLSDGSHSVTA